MLTLGARGARAGAWGRQGEGVWKGKARSQAFGAANVFSSFRKLMGFLL